MDAKCEVRLARYQWRLITPSLNFGASEKRDALYAEEDDCIHRDADIVPVPKLVFSAGIPHTLL